LLSQPGLWVDVLPPEHGLFERLDRHVRVSGRRTHVRQVLLQGRRDVLGLGGRLLLSVGVNAVRSVVLRVGSGVSQPLEGHLRLPAGNDAVW
jgi:hypothetical protein